MASNFDIVALAGAPFTALDRSYQVVVTNGQLTIQLVPVVSNPKISAIEIVPQSFTTLRVNAGGGTYTDSQGRSWAADNGFNGGSTSCTANAISSTTDPTLYQTERNSSTTLQYQFNNVPNNTYSVALRFAEIFFASAGQRVFNILINGQTVETNFDVFARAGGANRAIDTAYTVAVTNGQITIQLVRWSRIRRSARLRSPLRAT